MNFNLHSRTNLTRALTAAAAGAGVLALAACGPSPHPAPSASASKGAVAHQALAANDSHVDTPVHPGECASSGLSVQIAPYDAGAGHQYSRMTFTNTSGASCYLRGWPGVSYVAGDDGHQVGGSATRQSGNGVTTVRLAPGGHTYAFIDQPEVTNFPKTSCDPTSVRGYRIYPPDETAAKYVPSPDTQCASTSVGRPRISPVTSDPNGR